MLVYRRKGLLAGVKTDLGVPELLQYPYWVYYYRRSRILDLRALDAVSGTRVGNKIKMAMLTAFQETAQLENADG